MRSDLVLAPVAVAATALASPRLHIGPSSSLSKSAASHTISAGGDSMRYAPAQVPTLMLKGNEPQLTTTAPFGEKVSWDTAPWTTIVTSIIIGDDGPDSWLPFSWGPWMLPPLEDITCSVTSSSLPNWNSPDFPWIIPPHNHIRTEAPASISTARVPGWTETAPGSWGIQPREGVTCVGTTATSSFTPVPIWGGGGTSFFWGLPPRDDHDSTEAPNSRPTTAPSDWSTIFVTVIATASFAEEELGGVVSTLAYWGECKGRTTAMKRELDVTTITETETETDIVAITVSSIQVSETDSGTVPSSTSQKAIPTLSATQGPDLITASSVWVNGLPPPIPFDSIIMETLTMSIPEHGTTVADTSTWFGPWPSSTEMPFVTSPMIIQTTPTTFLTLPKTTDISSSATALSSHQCNEEYCSEDGTSYCFYWAGITTMGQQGPEPGETRVPLGACSVGAVPTSTVAARGWQFDYRRMYFW